jgi:secreted PhoX family phosphatase
MTDTTSPLTRRTFLHGALGTGAGLALAGPFAALGARTASAAPAGKPTGVGYGPLAPVRDQTTGLELLLLPKGFEYMSFGWTNDLMSDGVRTPSSHDGMAAFRAGDIVRLVRNHERGTGTPFATSDATYDSRASGGTTNLVFDPDAGEFLDDYASLSGTIRNCAGGPTPRGTWLTCEETTDIVSGTRHGYVFEVPSDGASNAEPIIGMGRFSHEANATDPATGIVYETEDSGNSALYRYVPTDAGNLAAGGVLEAMVLEGTTDTLPWITGQSAAASWVVIDSPDFGPGEPSPGSQARAKGSARISRGEGCWYGNGVIYVISTDGATSRQGQVFAYDPVASTFTCVFASPAANVLNNPDNVTVSPRGGLVLCEDGSGNEFLHGLTPDGEIFPFAQNNIVLPPEFQQSKGYSGDFTGSEWAGATFEPKNGNWLFANIQSPGVTFAITGPWRNGAL